jgi:hypothetical protein
VRENKGLTVVLERAQANGLRCVLEQLARASAERS